MRIGVGSLLTALAVASAVPIVIDADSTSASARSEIRLQLADLLLGDERYWESITAYDRAKEGAKPEQLLRASTGLLRSLLQVGEFTRGYEEALFLDGLGDTGSEHKSLYADALWSYGLFEEAEGTYRDILAVNPSSARARHGLGRSLAAQSRLDESLVELHAAIAVEDRAEFFHTLGTVYRRMNRYSEAADLFENYVARLPATGTTEKSEWARAEMRFMRSFGDRTPVVLDSPADQVYTIPFRLVRDKVVVRGRVNNGDRIDLVVDTGAEQMVMSLPTAQEAGVRPITNTLSAGVGDVGLRGLELGRIDSLKISDFSVNNVPVIIKNPPLTGVPETRVENSISPLAFGLSTVIDYKNHHLIMARRLPEEPSDIELPLRVHRLALVRGIVNQEYPKTFVVDTGGEVISISLSTANVLGMIPARYIPLQVFGTSGWDPDAFLLPGVHLAFDRIQYDNFSVVVLNLHRPSTLLGFNIGGIIGHNFLKNYRVEFDLEDSLLRLRQF